MPKFVATTSRGLVEVLQAELKDLDLNVVDKDNTSVTFDSNWRGCYKASMCSRTATRILMPILDFPAYQPEDLYHNAKKHDFTKYIEPTQTLAIDMSVRDSSFKDQRFVTLKIKDAIVDQFRDKYGVRPDIDSKNPDLKISGRVVKNQVSLSIDTSGMTLSMRGYRKESVTAPLREHLAAGLVKLTGWDGMKPIVDPMCGSGSFLIEAALMLNKVPAGSFRKGFGFQKLKGFQGEVWDEVVSESLDQEKDYRDKLFYGSDISGKSVAAAKFNVEEAGVEDLVSIKKMPVSMIEPPEGPPGILIINPPYGERLKMDYQVDEAYKDLGHVLKQKFKGWTLWLLSGNQELTKDLGMKSSRKIPVWNGNIECRFLEYPIN